MTNRHRHLVVSRNSDILELLHVVWRVWHIAVGHRLWAITRSLLQSHFIALRNPVYLDEWCIRFFLLWVILLGEAALAIELTGAAHWDRLRRWCIWLAFVTRVSNIPIFELVWAVEVAIDHIGRGLTKFEDTFKRCSIIVVPHYEMKLALLLILWVLEHFVE